MKNTFSILVIAMTILTCNAQQKRIGFGLKEGLNLTSFAGGSSDTYPNVSIQLGGFTEILIGKKYALQTELFYSSQAGFFNYYEVFSSPKQVFSTKRSASLKLYYINMPVLLKYYFMDRLFLESGPQLSYKVRSSLRGYAKDRYNTEISDAIKDLDFGYTIGVGYRLRPNLFFSCRFYWGIPYIGKSEEFKFSRDIDLKTRNRSFQLSAGYKFRIIY